MPKKNIFDSIAGEINTFFKPHGTLANVTHDIGSYIDNRFIKPVSSVVSSVGKGIENISETPKQLITSAPQIIQSTGSGVSQIFDSTGKAVSSSLSNAALPLLIGGATLIAFTVLNK